MIPFGHGDGAFHAPLNFAYVMAYLQGVNPPPTAAPLQRAISWLHSEH
jgi:hypothetical protein